MKTGILLLVLPVVPLLLAVAPPPLAQPDAKDANARLYERPVNGQTRPPSDFPALKKNAEGYWMVDFRHLASFAYEAPQTETPAKPGSSRIQPLFQPDPVAPGAAEAPGTADRIPPEVRALDGKRVCISGYMLPVTFDEKGFVKDFLVIRSNMTCCYGVVPGPNEWVVARMNANGKKAVPTMDVPLDFYGTLHVGEIFEGGAFEGLYRLDGDKVSIHPYAASDPTITPLVALPAVPKAP
jgi:hypothetical protein